MSEFIYTTKAYPTEYRGQMYRSRLEARWAAFFYLIGIDAVYEPVDLGAWSPDFLLRDRSIGTEILVEIKPVSSPLYETLEKIFVATEESKFEGDAMLFGVAPFLDRGAAALGWVSTGEAIDATAYVGMTPDPEKPIFRPDIIYFSPDNKWCRGSLSGDRGEIRSVISHRFSYLNYIMEVWGSACSAVQWNPDR